MTLVPVPVFTYPDATQVQMAIGSGVPNRANLRLDSTTTKVAWVGCAPYSGEIDKIVWVTGTVTTATGDVKVSLQTVSGGDPTGTLKDTNSYAVRTTDQASGTIYEETLTGAATVTAGDIVAVVFEWETNVGDIYLMQQHGNQVFPYSSQFTAAWAKSAYNTPVGFHYSDGGGYYAPNYPTGPLYWYTGYWSYDAGSSDDEYGLSFTPPFKCRAIGAYLHGRYEDTSAAAVITLYEDTTARAVWTAPAATNINNTTYTQFGYFAAPYTLTAGTTYIIAAQATHATSNIRLSYGNILSGAQRAVMLPASAGSVQRDHEGAWDAVIDTQIPGIGIIIDQVDDGAGAGGGGGGPRVASMNGGLS